MPGSALAQCGDVVVAARTFDAMHAPKSEARDRGSAVTLSILLHLMLLLPLIAWRFDIPGIVPALALPLEVELVDGRDLQKDDAPQSDSTAPAALSTPRSSNSPPVATTSKPALPAPGEPQSRDRDTTAEKSVPGESPAPQDSTLPPLPVAKDAVLPEKADDPAETEHVEMPVTQQNVLARRVMEGIRHFDDSVDTPAKLSWTSQGQTFTAVLTREPTDGDTAIERVSVEIQSQDQGTLKHTRMQIKRLAFSHFTQLVDHWDSSVQLHDDEIAGRFHSNSTIVVGYDHGAMPRFLGKVTTAAHSYLTAEAAGYRNRSEIFVGGLETHTDRVLLPQRFLHPPEQGAQVRTFSYDTRITFLADGSYQWAAAGSRYPDGREFINASTYLMAAEHTTLYVSGVVAGQVTVYSPQRIVIEGSLTYAHDPRSTHSADCLGLVSDQLIEIAGQEVTGAGDLEIDAALYARRRFLVNDIDALNHGTLLVFGSLTAGSMSAEEPRYTTKIHFDKRFEDLRPPGFPQTSRFEIDKWDATWRAVSGSS